MFKRTFLLLLLVRLATGTAWAADDSMVGDWKLNPRKSKLTDEMKVTSLGGNKYSFDFGGGSPETIVVDGTDQPGNFGTTFAVTAQPSPSGWIGGHGKAPSPRLWIFTLSENRECRNRTHSAIGAGLLILPIRTATNIERTGSNLVRLRSRQIRIGADVAVRPKPKA